MSVRPHQSANMRRVKTFRYPPRTRIRALEIFHRARGDVSVLKIIKQLAEEGHGDVARNAVERWLREDPSKRAAQAAALGQRLRHEAATANPGTDAAERLNRSANQLADLISVAGKRAQRDIASIEIRTVEDLARVTSCLCDMANALVEGSRAISELRKAWVNAINAPAPE